jgi:RNA polymerase sigma-70 factor (ECF subfamily)
MKSRQQYAHIEVSDVLDAVSYEEADDKIKVNDHRKAIRQSFGRLPDNQRTAFILQKYEDLSYEEISKVMNMSLSSVQSLIFRARKNLQEYLREYFNKNFR